MKTEIATLTKENALTVYQQVNGLDPYLAQIRSEIDSFVPDVTTKKGRDAIASIAYKVSKSKTALDDIGKDLVAELKELPKKIDLERKRVRELLDSWRDEIRKPLTDWEQAEENRIAAHKLNIEGIKRATYEIEEIDSATIITRIKGIESVVTDAASFEEFELEAMHAKESTLKQLNYALTKRQQHEQEQAELAKLRAEAAAREQKEREERIAKEAEERAKLAAEEAAKKEREAAERREIELKLQAEKAEREKLESIQREENAKREAIEREERLKVEAEDRQKKAIEAEKKRQADEAAAIEAERLKREKNVAHMKKINNEALKAFIDNGLTEECAKLAISLIYKKVIPNITINY
jgi:hypothetical protein